MREKIANIVNIDRADGTRQAHVGLASLKLLLLVIFVMISNEGLLGRVVGFWVRGHLPGLTALLGIWALALTTLVIVAFLPSLLQRLVWALPIAASTFMGALALEVTNSHLTYYDVMLYWAERSHMGDALGIYAHFGFIVAGKTLIGVAAILLPPGLRLPAPSMLMLTPITPIAAIVVLLLTHGGRGTKAFPEQFTSIAMVGALAITDPLSDGSERQPVTMKPTSPGAARHVVLVIEESLRGDFIDLNEPRGSTPYLASQSNRIANFGYAVAANNCSLFSNLAMRYGARPSDLAGGVQTNPSIWLYAKAAGYRTAYLEAQQVVGRLQDGMNLVERQQLDIFEQFSNRSRTERDVLMAARLKELLEAPEPSFIYVNKWGTHFPYVLNYPEGREPFQPTLKGEAMGEDRTLMINSYKNSVHWNVDGFFRELLADDFEDIVLIYTSDHGQNLMDGGIMPHCNPSDPHELEGVVPLLAMSGDHALQRRLEEAARLNHDRASHFQIFPTLLGLLGYDPAEIRRVYGPDLLEPIKDEEVVRAFSYGSIAGPPGTKIKWKDMPDDLTTLVRESLTH